MRYGNDLWESELRRYGVGVCMAWRKMWLLMRVMQQEAIMTSWIPSL